MHRRTLLLTGLVCSVTAHGATPGLDLRLDALLRAAVQAEERRLGGRIGMALVDRGSGRRFAYRGGELFPLCSTFKLLVAAAILARVDAGTERLDAAVAVSRADLLGNSPFSETRAGGTATVAELCAAAIGQSDNAAANLLLPRIGGPAGLTRFVRASGDPVTRLDRTEPTLNTATPGDRRDTTAPAAMLATAERLLFGRTLAPASRARLTDWMAASTTGAHRLRAGLPPAWAVADKTGAGAHGSDNEVALLTPPGRPPLLVATYLTGSDRDLADTNAAHAAIGRAIAAAFG